MSCDSMIVCNYKKWGKSLEEHLLLFFRYKSQVSQNYNAVALRRLKPVK